MLENLISPETLLKMIPKKQIKEALSGLDNVVKQICEVEIENEPQKVGALMILTIDDKPHVIRVILDKTQFKTALTQISFVLDGKERSSLLLSELLTNLITM